ncbi:MAG: biopolymer transporter ExbD [Puniceicoccales bacterium]|jgi:biopolymer transport protein ExbD|nr:biopolymer transporter ExbD [Puniceicoccales bacterium]
MKRVNAERTGDLGFQIAPMIDVVFVIMLFFMVMAGQVSLEYELKIKLPGEETPADAPQEIPDELTISLTATGEVSINDNTVSMSSDAPEQSGLFTEFASLARNAVNAKTSLLITVQADEVTRYDKIALVLDTLALAFNKVGIVEKSRNVTFSIGDPEE